MPISSHKPFVPDKDHIRGPRLCSCSSNPLPRISVPLGILVPLRHSVVSLGALVPLRHSVVSLDIVVPLCLFVPCHLYICVLEFDLLTIMVLPMVLMLEGNLKLSELDNLIWSRHSIRSTAFSNLGFIFKHNLPSATCAQRVLSYHLI